MSATYDACLRLGCQERASGGLECRDLCKRAQDVRLDECGPLESLARHRPRTSAGHAFMSRLMQRTRVERDFGGVEDA